MIWDLPVRLFHWGLVLSVLTAAVTGFLAPEWWLDVHVWAGYAIAFLVAFRIVWGFAGTRFARFSSFVFSPRKTMEHARLSLSGKAGHHAGHNPLGALMVFALLFVLAGLTISGMLVLGGQEKLGPLAGFTSFATGSAVLEFHEVLAFALLAMIVAHVAGVIWESRIGGENLVRAMVTGRKQRGPVVPERHFARPVIFRALAIAVFLVGAGYSATVYTGQFPPLGIAQVQTSRIYASECGDCHFAFPPGLLPRSSWQKILASLDDHFGEDASLDAESVSAIGLWLSENAAETQDSEAANNLRKISLKDPMRITATPYWQKRHGDVEAAVFQQKNIGSKSNCIACHGDAESGRFDDHMISIPHPSR